jgi:prepilin-type N-terminal cleavage/methylation domain-containing protein
MQKKDYRNHGFTLVETIVAIGVFSIFFAAIAIILQQVLQNIGTGRVRSIALSLAQQRMEIIKNLPYANVGTVGGIPSGPVTQSEVVTQNGIQFTILTSIQYIDDPFDGVAPADAIPADYKRTRIQITWNGQFQSVAPMTLVSNIVPKGIETNPGGGTVYLRVLNAQGVPLSNANVAISNSVVVPHINATYQSDSTGTVLLPGSPACVSCYNVSVTKQGYSSDRTYTTAEVANPLLAPLTLIEGQIAQATFTIDRVGGLTVNAVGTKELGYPPLVNVIFTLRGSKIIGYDTSDNPVYKYAFQTTTGGGSVGIPALEWDNYTVDLSNSNYTLAASTPLMPMQLWPASASSVLVVAAPKYNTSFQLTVKNQDGILQASASAELLNTQLGIDLTKITPATGSPDYGQVFFNNTLPTVYDLLINLPGYETSSTSVNLTSNLQQTVVLNPYVAP